MNLLAPKGGGWMWDFASVEDVYVLPMHGWMKNDLSIVQL
jgi:hypothetical protein